MNRMWRGAGQLLAGLVVFAVLALVLGISLAHRGDGGNPASAHVHGPRTTASPSPSSSPTPTIDLPYTGWQGRQSQAPNPLPEGIHVSGQIVC